MSVFVPRSAWGLPVTWDRVRVAPSQRTGFAVHWDGGPSPKTEADEVRLLLAYHRYHLNTAKTGGFDYNLAVGPVSGKIYEGRGLDIRGAHAGGQNTPLIGVILIGGPGNLTEKGKQGLRDAYALACQHTGKRLTQLAHRDLNNTGCPGDQIAAWVRAGGLAGGSAPSGGGTPSGGGAVSGGTAGVGRNLTSRPTKDVQRLVGAVQDGVYGPDTTAKVKAWQKARGLAADGVWGPLSDAEGFPPSKPTGALPAPAFPLQNDDWYFGPKSGPKESVSGYFGYRDDLRRWQQRMKDRGWDINPDGLYGPQTEKIAIAFQKGKRLQVDGRIGAATWRAAWTEPVT